MMENRKTRVVVIRSSLRLVCQV